MKLFFTLLGVTFLCLLCSTSGVVNSGESEVSEVNFNECKSGSCVPLAKCSSLMELRRKIRASKGSYKELVNKLQNLQCDYKPSTRLPYFCCADENNDENEPQHLDLSKHENRKLFLTRDSGCGYEEYNVGSYLSPLNNASLYESNWLALIKYNGRIITSGTLINNRYVLTNARYAEYFKKGVENIEITLGEHNIESNPDCIKYRNGKSDCTSTVNVGVEEIHVHPGFSKKYLTNDIALLRLNEQITPSLNVQPVCLPFENEVSLLDIPYDVYGFGVSIGNGYESATKLKNELNIVDNHQCELLYRYNNNNRRIDNSMVCLTPNVRPNVCVPDNGGDLSHTFGRSRFQLGVASFDSVKCSLNLPFVYTKLTPHLKWILDTVRE